METTTPIVIDPITLKRIEALHPSLRPSVKTGVERCYKNGVRIRLTRTLATWDEQNELYAQGRTKPGKIVTYAKGGESYHNYGLAFDFVLLHEDKEVSWDMNEDLDQDQVSDWMEVVSVFQSMGFEWGGVWPKPKRDTPHFQRTYGFSVRELLAKHNAADVDPKGYVTLIKR